MVSGVWVFKFFKFIKFFKFFKFLKFFKFFKLFRGRGAGERQMEGREDRQTRASFSI